MARKQVVVKYGSPQDLRMREMASRHPMRCVYPDSRFDEKSQPGGGTWGRPINFRENVAWVPPTRKAESRLVQAVNKPITLAALKSEQSVGIDIKGTRIDGRSTESEATRAAWRRGAEYTRW